VSALPIETNGKLRPAQSLVQHKGISINSEGKPQAHSITIDPTNHFAFAADLGLDRFFSYRLDPAKATLESNTPAYTKVTAGAGPRHFTFHPAGAYAYGINELNNTVTVFAFDPQFGELRPQQDISTLPDGFSGESYAAEVQLHPNGKFLYASNRGHDSIAVFSVNDKGQLASRGYQAAGGRAPRHFAIDPAGAFLVVANQKSNGLAVFQIDRHTGQLTPTGEQVTLDVPVCVKFLPLK
jgi:6-phosphogluconolactonase